MKRMGSSRQRCGETFEPRRLEGTIYRAALTASLRLLHYYSAGRSIMIGAAFLTSGPGTLATTATVETDGRDSLRMPARSSHLPRIIFPAVVCITDLTEVSTDSPIILRE